MVRTGAVEVTVDLRVGEEDKPEEGDDSGEEAHSEGICLRLGVDGW